MVPNTTGVRLAATGSEEAWERTFFDRRAGNWLLLLIALAGVTVASCKRASSDSVEQPLPVIRDDGALLFTFFDSSATMRTVDRIDNIDLPTRAAVMVTDPKGKLEHNLIYVADVSSLAKDGRYKVWIEPRGRWLDRVMPAISEIKVAEATPLDQPQRPRKKPRIARKRLKRAQSKPKHVAQAAPLPSGPRVTVYGTSWCPSCRVARAYFSERGIKFEDLDVERDAQAARRFAEVQRANNLRAGAVPLIVINGRAFQGFSRPRIEAALALSGNPRSV